VISNTKNQGPYTIPKPYLTLPGFDLNI